MGIAATAPSIRSASPNSANSAAAWWQKLGLSSHSTTDNTAEEQQQRCADRGDAIRALQEAHDRELAEQRADYLEQLSALRKEVKQLQNEKRQIWLRCRWQNAA